MGTTRDLGPFGLNVNLPLPTGMFNIGGNIATAGGLIFVGAFGDDYLRAVDERTGAVVWKARLPAGGQATPMTYRGADGRQYVVIAAGGHGGLGTTAGDAVRSEEHTSELQSLMRISYAVFCLQKKISKSRTEPLITQLALHN